MIGKANLNISPQLRQHMPQSVIKLATLSFTPAVRISENAGKRPGFHYPFPSHKSILGHSSVGVTRLDCHASHFKGISAGDIITGRKGSKWGHDLYHVEGYAHDEKSSDGKGFLMFGRMLMPPIGLMEDVYFEFSIKEVDDLIVVKKHGEYDPVVEHGFDPVDEKYAMEPRAIDREALLKEIQEARGIVRTGAEDRRLTAQEVFSRFTAAILRIESADLFRSINTIFPLKDFHGIMRSLRESRSASSILEINDGFYADPASHFEHPYPAERLEKIMTLIEKIRQLKGPDMPLHVLSWLKAGLHNKTGIYLSLGMEENMLVERIPEVINTAISQMAEYLAPLYDSKRKDEAVDVYARRPVYFWELLEKYPDPIAAAEHVTLVALNAITGMLEEACTKEEMRIAPPTHTRSAEHTKAEGLAATLMNCFGLTNEYRSSLESASSLFDEFTTEIRAIFKGLNNYTVTRGMTREWLLGEAEKAEDKIKRATENFAKHLREHVEKEMSQFSGVLMPAFFDTPLLESMNNLAVLFMINLKKEYSGIIDECLETLKNDPKLKSKTLNGEFPFKKAKWRGLNVDCTRDDFGVRAGDILWYYFIDPIRGKRRKKLCLCLGHIGEDAIYLVPLEREEGKLVFHTDNSGYVEMESPVTQEMVHKRWGDYEPEILESRDDWGRIIDGNVLPMWADPGRMTEEARRAFFDPLNRFEFLLPSYEVQNQIGRPLMENIYREMESGAVPLKVKLMYNDADIYSVYPQVPPASSGKNVLRFEISTGCEHRKCTYCSLYEWEKFSLMEFGKFKKHFGLIREYLGTLSLHRDFDRVFLTGGNGLVMPTARLLAILAYIKENKEDAVSKIRRIESYARTAAILRHGKEGLKQLRKAGLNMVFWGIESGSDSVLEMTRRGYTQANILEAASALREAGIEMSVMIMPGLGGKKFAKEHASATADVIARIFPRYVTFMGVHAPGTLYERQMAESSDNRPLTAEEMATHMALIRGLIREILSRNNPFGPDLKMRLAAHTLDITPVCRNPITFSVTL